LVHKTGNPSRETDTELVKIKVSEAHLQMLFHAHIWNQAILHDIKLYDLKPVFANTKQRNQMMACFHVDADL